MAKTIAQLRTEAQTIKNETTIGANTATRVGGFGEDIVDYLDTEIDSIKDNADDEPVAGSGNLVKSGGVSENLSAVGLVKNIFTIKGKYISKTGALTNSAYDTTKTTELIPFTTGDILIAKNLQNATNYYPVAMFDSNKNFIVDGYVDGGGQRIVDVTLNEDNTPSNCAYVRLNTTQSNASTVLNGLFLSADDLQRNVQKNNQDIEAHGKFIGFPLKGTCNIIAGQSNYIVEIPKSDFPLNTKIKFRVNDLNENPSINKYCIVTNRGSSVEKGKSVEYKFSPNVYYVIDTVSTFPSGTLESLVRLVANASNSLRNGTISYEMCLDYVGTHDEYIDNLEGDIASIEENIDEIEEKLEFVETAVNFSIIGSYNYSNGALNSSTGNFRSTDLLSLSGVNKILYSGRGQGTACGIAFYDEGRTFISAIQTLQNEVVTLTQNNIPSNAAYVAFSARVDYTYYAKAYYKLDELIKTNSYEFPNDVYGGKKLCTIGSSSTEPCKWQEWFVKWNRMNFIKEEEQTGVGYVRIASAASYWLGLEWAESLPDNVTQTTIDVSVAGDGSSTITGWIDSDSQLWRKAFQLAKGGDSIKAGLGPNIFARAFDVQFYNPKVVMLMCYNEINYITTTSPYGSLGTVDDVPATSPNISASVLASYKAIIEHILINCPQCEIVLVSTKWNTYQIYGATAANVDMSTVHNSERYKKDKIYHDALKSLADYYGLKFIDLLSNTGINPWSIVPYMIALNNVHCNDLGYLMFYANNIHKQFNS